MNMGGGVVVNSPKRFLDALSATDATAYLVLYTFLMF